MPHVPEEVKLRLKREVSVQRLAEARGIKLRRSGKELIGLCPFHKDTNPSLNIDPVANVWHCKGACSEGGDVISWVMKAEGVSFKHAVELLKRDYLPMSATVPAGPPPKKTVITKLPALIEHTDDDKKLLNTIVTYYQQRLKENPVAQQYLIERGLKSSEMLDEFRIGLSDRSLSYHIPHSRKMDGAAQRGRLIELGILRKETGHEHFNGCVVIPILNLDGDVMQMYGRKITANLRPDLARHLYLPGPHRGVWNERALIAAKEIILCEALIDALTFWCAGYRNVTTIYGVNGFNEELRAALRQHGTRKIYLAYDRDDAGDKAAQAHSEELMSMGIECFRVQFPKGQDANEYAHMTRPADKALGVLLNSAAWLGKGQRPAVSVRKPALIELPQIEEEPSADVKKEIPAPSTEAAKEKIPFPPQPENVFSLAAFPEAVPSPAAAEVETLPASVRMSGNVAPYMHVEIKGEEVILTEGDRRYRVRGLSKNMSYELLKVNVLVSSLNGTEGFHVDNVDLYAARQRVVFAKQAAEELRVKEETIKRDLQHVLQKLELLQDEQIKRTLTTEETKVEMTAEEQAAALELLRDPRLLDRILIDFEKCGVVGEETNKKLSYLAAVSRLLNRPLAVVVQSASAAGKSSLMEAVLDFLPDDQRKEYSAMTGQALFYMGETDLKHKVLAVSEQEGAQRASYPLKLLQSEGVLTIASTGKDPVSGKHVTHLYRVEGPVMIFLTTTAIEMDEELLNRCLVLTVDEDQEQTQAIHQKQREARTLDGLWARQRRTEILKLHRNAQRLLQPIEVVNPYAPTLTFPSSRTRTRRDHMKFLTLIDAIALLHQHQREIKTDTREDKTLRYIEATEADVKLARQLVNQVLPPSLDDLQPQTRRLLLLLDQIVGRECQQHQVERAEYRFSRRMVRHWTQWGDSVLKKHLARLEEMEYLIVHRGGRGQSYVYELYFERDQEGNPIVPGLSGNSYDQKKSRPEEGLSPSSRPQVAGVSRGGHGQESPALTRVNQQNGHNLKKHSTRETAEEVGKNHVIAETKTNGHALAKRAGVK
jgi:DNA primase catalytic core